jgi:hypothetical protein
LIRNARKFGDVSGLGRTLVGPALSFGYLMSADWHGGQTLQRLPWNRIPSTSRTTLEMPLPQASLINQSGHRARLE